MPIPAIVFFNFHRQSATQKPPRIHQCRVRESSLQADCPDCNRWNRETLFLTVFENWILPWNPTCPWKSMVGRCIAYWNSPFLGDILVFRGVGLEMIPIYWIQWTVRQNVDSCDFSTPQEKNILHYSCVSHSFNSQGRWQREPQMFEVRILQMSICFLFQVA